jgi:large subunit ribosomal protein L16
MFKAPVKKKFIKNFLVYLKIIKKKTFCSTLQYGTYGIKAIESGYLSPQQLEATRRIFSRSIKKNFGQIWMRIVPNLSKTKKPNEMRMGKGKGPVKAWYYAVFPGCILFEISGISYINATILLRIASTKLPIKSKIVTLRK